MLTYNLLKNHAGVLLCGDYTSLDALLNVVHEVNEASPIITDKGGTFLGLAYDARKACSGQRRIIKPPKEFKEIGVRYGVEILWPVLLVQCRMLRVALGFFNNTKRQQAITYSMESVIEAALHDDFGGKAPLLIEHWMRIDPAHPWAEEKLHSRVAQFCIWTKKERNEKFIGLLASLDPMYPFLYEHWINQDDNVIDLAHRHYHRSNLVSPEDLDSLDGTEWVDCEW